MACEIEELNNIFLIKRKSLQQKNRIIYFAIVTVKSYIYKKSDFCCQDSTQYKKIYGVHYEGSLYTSSILYVTGTKYILFLKLKVREPFGTKSTCNWDMEKKLCFPPPLTLLKRHLGVKNCQNFRQPP